MNKNPYFVTGGLFLVFCVLFGLTWFGASRATVTDQWPDIFSLGQLLVEFCLVPVAIMGFVFTIREIRRSQQIATLDIAWKIDEGVFSKTISAESPSSGGFKTPLLALTNQGTAPSTQYQINLEFQLDYGSAKMALSEWKHSSQQFHKFIFRSEAHYISYPEDVIILGVMDFLEPRRLPNRTEIRYRIFGDKSEYKEGRLFIDFKERANTA